MNLIKTKRIIQNTVEICTWIWNAIRAFVSAKCSHPSRVPNKAWMNKDGIWSVFWEVHVEKLDRISILIRKWKRWTVWLSICTWRAPLSRFCSFGWMLRHVDYNVCKNKYIKYSNNLCYLKIVFIKPENQKKSPL